MMTTLCLFLVLLVCPTTEAFVSSSRVRGVVAISPRTTCLFAAASSPKKDADKKSKPKSADAAAKKEKEEVETFRKADFISSIQEKTGLSKVDSDAALQAVMETITEEVSAGKRVNLVGFGIFKLSYRSARKGRNPQTGEEMDIAASNSPGFSASKNFKEKCNPKR